MTTPADAITQEDPESPETRTQINLSPERNNEVTSGSIMEEKEKKLSPRMVSKKKKVKKTRLKSHDVNTISIELGKNKPATAINITKAASP